MVCPHTAALACVDQINKNVSSIFFFIFWETRCLKNAISSRQDALALWNLCWCGEGLLLSVLTTHVRTVSEVWQSGTEEVDTLGAGHRHVPLPGVKFCPPHWSSSWARSTEFAPACCFVGMHQSQSRHFGAKERQLMCPALGRTRWPPEVPFRQHFCDPVAVFCC